MLEHKLSICLIIRPISTEGIRDCGTVELWNCGTSIDDYLVKYSLFVHWGKCCLAIRLENRLFVSAGQWEHKLNVCKIFSISVLREFEMGHSSTSWLFANMLVIPLSGECGSAVAVDSVASACIGNSWITAFFFWKNFSQTLWLGVLWVSA